MRYNAQLSSPKRYYQLSVQHRNHQIQRKTKMPRVEGLLELFVMFWANWYDLDHKLHDLQLGHSNFLRD